MAELLFCSTQDLNDFFSYQDGAYGRGIINACKFKIVMGLEEEEAKRVQETLELDQAEINMVKQFSKGKGLVCVNTVMLQWILKRQILNVNCSRQIPKSLQP